MVAVGRHSDRTGERKLHVAACAMTASVGLVLAAASQGSLPLLVLSFTLSQMAQRFPRAIEIGVEDSKDGEIHDLGAKGTIIGRTRKNAPAFDRRNLWKSCRIPDKINESP